MRKPILEFSSNRQEPIRHCDGWCLNSKRSSLGFWTTDDTGAWRGDTQAGQFLLWWAIEEQRRNRVVETRCPTLVRGLRRHRPTCQPSRFSGPVAPPAQSLHPAKPEGLNGQRPLRSLANLDWLPGGAGPWQARRSLLSLKNINTSKLHAASMRRSALVSYQSNDAQTRMLTSSLSSGTTEGTRREKSSE